MARRTEAAPSLGNVSYGDPERACNKPELLVMEAVNKKIGQPPYKADTRFQVEGFFLSFELRYVLAEIAQS